MYTNVLIDLYFKYAYVVISLDEFILFISLKRCTISKLSSRSEYNDDTKPLVNILLINSKMPEKNVVRI